MVWVLVTEVDGRVGREMGTREMEKGDFEKRRVLCVPCVQRVQCVMCATCAMCAMCDV